MAVASGGSVLFSGAYIEASITYNRMHKVFIINYNKSVMLVGCDFNETKNASHFSGFKLVLVHKCYL